MTKKEIEEILKRKFTDSDDDLRDLGAIVDALDGLDRLDEMQSRLDEMTLAHEEELERLDKSWRARYRERFFSGESMIDEEIREEETPDADTDVYTIEDYLKDMEKEN